MFTPRDVYFPVPNLGHFEDGAIIHLEQNRQATVFPDRHGGYVALLVYRVQDTVRALRVQRLWGKLVGGIGAWLLSLAFGVTTTVAHHLALGASPRCWIRAITGSRYSACSR